ncbi:MAG: hypothetical protein FJW35_16035 [Acidobacteria bacterium]|nr:hypothetical protein [Acidobacteriota bacterium]
MHVRDVFAQCRTTFSFDLIPPKDVRAAQALFQAIRDLMPLQPAYVSVTYGAGGCTREPTHDLVVRIRKETPLTLVSQDARKITG